jgi:flagellin
MGMLTNIYTTALNLGNIYTQNNALLSQSLQRLSTGKKINNPSDDLGGYTRAMDLKTSYDVYGSINQNLQDWKGAMDVASTAAGSINSSLQRMQELIDLSQTASTNDEKDADQAEFTQLAASIQTTRNSTNSNGAYLLKTGSSLASIPLVPGSAAPTLDINFTAPAISDTNLANLNDPTKIKIGHTAPDYAGTQSYLDAVTADMATYNAKVEGFSKQIDTFTNINNTIITNQKSAASSVTDINEADELAQYNMLNIRQQGSVAMLAQANLSAQNMLILYGFKNA